MRFSNEQIIRCKFDFEGADIIKSLIPHIDTAKFFAMQKNRILVGEMRYEGNPLIDPELGCVGLGYSFYKWSPRLFLRSLRRKQQHYAETGNTELLVDICNYAMFLRLTSDKENFRWQCLWLWATEIVEFFYPTHPNAHFHALDQGVTGTKFSASADPVVVAFRRKNQQAN